MSSMTRASRPLRPALTLLVALLAALAALAFWGGPGAQANDNGTRAAKAKISQTELALRNDMRRLWEDHVTWTRLAIISLTTDAPDTEATVGRLLQNQTDIGNAIEPFYGEAAGDELTRLLREHILIAADLVAAARAGDQAAVADAQSRWSANADEIAGFLAKANPAHWPVSTMSPMMREHLDHTLSEAVNQLKGDFPAGIADYDRIHVQILEMSDMLTDGIVRQHPGQFS